MRFFRANPDCSSRFHEEEEHNYRNAFSRDRDRILYSKEFRRLSGKTQVFVVGFYDHARTRLTHTLEVAQISKTIAAKLGLDENLCESISFGHDVGHTPFGHVGERTLNLLMNGCDKYKGLNKELPENQKGFKHNWQGLRVTIDLEKYSPSYRGLNLTDYTLWGILNHSNLEYKKCDHAEDMNLQNVRFYGQRPLVEMPEFYAWADAMLVTLNKNDNVSNTLPGKVQSYMAAGKPVLGSIDGEANRVIKTSRCGLCCPAEDHRAFAKIIEEFADHPAKHRLFAANSLKYYQQNFGETAFFNKLYQSLETLCDKPELAVLSEQSKIRQIRTKTIDVEAPAYQTGNHIG